MQLFCKSYVFVKGKDQQTAKDQLLLLAATAEQDSEHPIAKAILRAVKDRGNNNNNNINNYCYYSTNNINNNKHNNNNIYIYIY